MGSVTLASAFLARGKVPLSDLLTCVMDAQTKLTFPEWNPDACKIGMCSTPSPGDQSSVMAVYNSTAFGTVLSREMSGFLKLFRSGAMLHHYTEFAPKSEIAAAEENVASVIADYQDLENGTFPNMSRRNTQQQHQLQQGGGVRSGSRGGAGRSERGSGGGDERVKQRGEPSGAWSDPTMHQLFPSF
eukprot:gene28519-35390_t